MKREMLVFGGLFVFFLFVPCVYGYEVDLVSSVTGVIDGDSFYIVDDEVRLADVSAPEWDEPGGSEATDLLTELIEGKTVYLDTDDASGRDRYGRLIAVVYVELNETHYLNVNCFLLDSEVYELTDYSNNEWNPYEWNLIERYAFIEPEIGDSVNETTEESEIIEFEHDLTEIDPEALNEIEVEEENLTSSPNRILGFQIHLIIASIVLFIMIRMKKYSIGEPCSYSSPVSSLLFLFPVT